MVKLLVIADDFTGALDTGVQFKAKGTLIQVGTGSDLFAPERDQVQVLIIDAETRHMSPEEAYRTVSGIVAQAVRAGVSCIYKKTDSGLRGNIGSELTAMLQASGQERLHFIPAFPKVGRTTVEGVHYIDGVPVAQSVFGADPFEPVRCSAVREIIAQQSRTATHLMGARIPDQLPQGVLVYDAQTDEELFQIAAGLKERDQLHLLVGCAGFAAVLPTLLELEQDDSNLPAFYPKLLTICGSINPITLSQLEAAERAGVQRIRLTPRQKLEPGWLDSAEGLRTLARWLSQIQACGSTVIECDGRDDEEETRACVARLGLGLEEVRRRIADTMGGVLEHLMDLGLESTLLVTGGDTLLAFMRRIQQGQLTPICELTPGVALSQIQYRGKTYNLMSKSGGFGGETLIADLEQLIVHHSKEELVC